MDINEKAIELHKYTDSILFAMANPIPEIMPDALNAELANVVAQAVKRYI